MTAGGSYSIWEKFKLFGLFSVCYGIFYIVPNFYAQWQPLQLPLTDFDKTVPFLPWTFLVYTSDYVLIALAVLLVSNKEHFASFSRMMFSALILSGLFFWIFPTTYPRPIYPSVENSWIQAAMDLVYVADTPNNCFPSMHVALTTIAAWNLRRRSRPEVFFFSVWTLAVIVSTLTTKQHYLADVVGGLGLVLVVILCERFFLSRYCPKLCKLGKMVEPSGFTKIF